MNHKCRETVENGRSTTRECVIGLSMWVIFAPVKI